ncbi:unnamed protein product [Nezara viridula]|uniref:Kelch-like protein diablo n=1 Tax=Nezara viridula TaxID=85310 RepID=A0A9P0H930_NEZVI|nr:unnamed protein product [Nezara viridula]
MSVNSEGSDEKRVGHYSNPEHPTEGFKRMSYLFITDQLTDVTLKAGDTSLKVHRVVLASVSDYFLAMFKSDLIESKAELVEMKEVDGHALSSLVSYAYTGNIDVKEETVESVLAAAVLLRFPEVVDACTNFIIQQLDPSNCIGIATFAESRNCCQLRDVAVAYTEENFELVAENEEFLLMQLEDFVKLISSDYINVTSEVSVFQAVIKWIDYDIKNRCVHLERLMGFVKLPLLPPQFLVEDVVPKIGQCGTSMVIDALSYHAVPERRTKFPPARITPRKSTIGSLYFVAGCERVEGFLHCACTVKEYSPRHNRWRMVAKKCNQRLQLGVTSLDHRIFMIGGRDGIRTLNTVEYLDLNCMVWADISPMLTARHALGAATWGSGGPIYAVGGDDGWSFLNTIERWDPGTGEWSYAKPMSSPRSLSGVACLLNRLYVAGGRNGIACLDLLEAYDPLSGIWHSCAPMSTRRGGITAVVLGESLYVIGGIDLPCSGTRFSSAEKYDPRADSWMPVSPMSVCRDGIGAAVLGNKIYAVGGYDGESYLKTVEEYDSFTDTWRLMAPLNSGKSGSCVAYNKK